MEIEDCDTLFLGGRTNRVAKKGESDEARNEDFRGERPCDGCFMCCSGFGDWI